MSSPVNVIKTVQLAATFTGLGWAATPVGAAGAPAAAYQDIETVEVTAAAVPPDGETGSVAVIDDWQLDLAKPVTVAEALALAPSANIRTNSRGETLVSLRGSGERQFALFLDGVPVNVPWDNRFDLSLLPLLTVERINVAMGPVTPLYGANTAGGVVALTPTDRPGTKGEARTATGGMFAADAVFSADVAGFDAAIAASYLEQDGLPAPDTRYAPAGGDLITNTDREQANLLMRLARDSGRSRGALMLLLSDAAYGIAPEQGPRVDPADARYWRYPDTDHLLVAAQGEIALGQGTAIEGALWHQSFDQDIDSYTHNSYQRLEETQRDSNNAFGARGAVSYEGQKHLLTVSAMAHWAGHDQQAVAPGEAPDDAEEFSQIVTSIAAHYGWIARPAVKLSLSASIDRLEPRKTGGRQNTGDFSGINATAEAAWRPTGPWSLRASAGRRVRLPTLRELFGTAIGRFLPNPDLEPETSWLFEASAQYQRRDLAFTITPFYVDTSGTLDQARVSADGANLRQRVNLRGSTSWGVETRGEAAISSALRLSVNATWNKARAKPESVANTVRRLYLSDRPNWLVRATAEYQVGARTMAGLAVVHRGEAKSQDAAGAFQDLAAATRVDMSLRHLFTRADGGTDIEAYLRIDNLTDAFIEPQLGLPDPGRRVTVGLRAAF